MLLRFVWDPSVFTQYSYYRDLFCLEPALRLRYCYCHGWVCYIDTTKIMVWCMSLLIFSIYLRWLCSFIMIYFNLTNDAMVKWCNGKIKIGIGCFFSHKYRICSFVWFSNTAFLQQIKQSITINFWLLTTSTETKFMLSNQATTERRGFIRGQLIFVR